jgi:hypothetical protein
VYSSISPTEYEGLIGEWCAVNDHYISGSGVEPGSCTSGSPCKTILYVLSENSALSYITVNVLADVRDDTVVEINRSILLQSSPTTTPFTIIAVSSPDKNRTSFMNVINGGSLRIRSVVLVVNWGYNYTLITVKSGSLVMEDSQFSITGTDATMTVPLIVQEMGSTTLRLRPSTLTLNLNNQSSAINLKAVPFVQVSDGSFQMVGISDTVTIGMEMLKATVADGARSLFLEARASSAQLITRTVTLRNAVFKNCNYSRPASGTLKGGLISVLGDNVHRIILVRENVKFEDIRFISGTSASGTPNGDVNGGAIYGGFLLRVSITKGVFIKCNTSSGSGGALYIEEVETYLQKDDIMSGMFCVVCVCSSELIFHLNLFFLFWVFFKSLTCLNLKERIKNCIDVHVYMLLIQVFGLLIQNSTLARRLSMEGQSFSEPMLISLFLTLLYPLRLIVRLKTVLHPILLVAEELQATLLLRRTTGKLLSTLVITLPKGLERATIIAI